MTWRPPWILVERMWVVARQQIRELRQRVPVLEFFWELTGEAVGAGVATAERSSGSGEGGLCPAAAAVGGNRVGTGDALGGTTCLDSDSGVGSGIPGVPEPPQAATASARTTANGTPFKLKAAITLRGDGTALIPILLALVLTANVDCGLIRGFAF